MAVVLTACLAARAAAEAPAVQFTKKPTAHKTARGVQVEFALRTATDVAVFVEDASGKVIRHLVAGVLGPNPPAPLQPGSLEQSLTWDGKDDWGRPAAGGPFTVRVRAGTRAEFDRFLGFNPDTCGRVSAIAVGPGGTVYVFHLDNTANDNMGGVKLKVFTRDGKHQKVLIPFPADIARERIKALGAFEDPEGDLIPRVHNWEHLSFYPDTVGGRGRDMPEFGELPAVDSKGRVYWMVHGPSLCAVDADGGIPYDAFIGPKLLAGIKGLKMAGEGPWEYSAERPSLAVSSDDKFVYFAGLSAAAPLPCVFRVPVDTRGPAEVFLGTLDRPGKDQASLTAPRGIAVAKGLVYVADPGADRIAVFREADCSFVGQVRVKNPQCVGVDPASGALYVCVYGGKSAALLKFSGLDGGRELYRMALPASLIAGQTRIAVDGSARPVRIWVPEVIYAPWSLKCIEDAGERFVDKGDPQGKDLWIPGPRDLTLDRDRGELYIKGNFGKMNAQKFYRFEERTCKLLADYDPGKFVGSTASGVQMVPGSDGALYTVSFGNGLMRFDRQFNKLNFAGLNGNQIPIGGVMNFQQRYLALKPYAAVDEIYVVPPPFYRLMVEQKLAYETAERKIRGQMNGRYTCLNVLGRDGKTKRTVIWECLDSAVPRVDRWGNIYLVDLVKPLDRAYPEFFDGKLPEAGGKEGTRRSDVLWNAAMYASIIKFPPRGGAIWYRKSDKLPASCVGTPSPELLAQPTIPFKTVYGEPPHTGAVQGALWCHFGYSPYSMPGSGSMCNCEASGFDVDPFGRFFFPNLGLSRVEIIDSNNNPIATFGKYGNEDSGGENAKVSKPEIPFAWPVYVVASDTHAYVADTVNRRTVRVKLACAAEATCQVH
jgi:hypothetical protein